METLIKHYAFQAMVMLRLCFQLTSITVNNVFLKTDCTFIAELSPEPNVSVSSNESLTHVLVITSAAHLYFVNFVSALIL